MKDFLILGGDSTLALCFSKYFKNNSLSLSKSECDITNIRLLEQVIKSTRCKYIINCAAITNIEYCEYNPITCFDVNSIAVNNLSASCTEYNKKLIHLSSDYAVKPINVYGYSKYISEKIIDNNHLVIRTSFYSDKYYIIKSLLDGKITFVYKNLYFNPVSINRLVQEMYNNRDKTGIINVFSNKKISKYTFANMVVEVFKLKSNLIKPVNYNNNLNAVPLPVSSFVKSDINIPLYEDILFFKQSRDILSSH
jgi:dTDP-4-dehydrorhamnose reductase